MSQIVERFSRIRRDTPSRPLIHSPVRQSTYTADDVWADAVHQRSQLERSGVSRGDLVLYAGGNRLDTFGFWLACGSVGAAIMPVDAGTTIPELIALAHRFGAGAVILDAGAAATAPLQAADPYGSGLLLVRPDLPADARQSYPGAAVLKLTSGSTGLPKATFTTEAQLVLDADNIMSAMDIRPDDCQIAAIPLSHAYGIGNLVMPLLLTGTRIVLREGFVAHQIQADATAYGARILPGVPFMFDHFTSHFAPGAWPKGLEIVISAGARLELSTVRNFYSSFGLKIHSFYGTSETGGITYDDDLEIHEPVTVGRAMPGVTISLRSETDVPAGVGRVHVAGGAVASGYAGESRMDDAFAGGGFLTGDLGLLTERHHLVLTGRVSAFINVAGRKVLPQEVEDVLRSMPGIADARVLGIPDATRGQCVVACIVPDKEIPTALTVRRHCAAHLAPYKIPRAIVALDHIPLTERGKTDQRRLEELVGDYLNGAPQIGML